MELLAGILLVIGLLTGIIVVIASGIYVVVAAAMYSGGTKEDKSFWRSYVIFLRVSFLGITFLIYYLLHSAYVSLQAGNPSKTILLLSIEIIPLLILLVYFSINRKVAQARNKKKEDETPLPQA